MPKLEVLRKGKIVRELDLDKPVVFVGREVDLDIRLVDPDVSRRHARLVIKEGNYWVEDMQSTHGIFLNGRRAYNEQLSTGDRIQIGSYILRFIKEDGEVMKHFDASTSLIEAVESDLKTITDLNKTRPVSMSKRPVERQKNLARTEPHFIRSKPQPPKLMAIKYVRNVVGMSDDCHIREFATGKSEAAVLVRGIDGQISIRKMGLISIVKVNGHSTSEQTLKDGDNVTIGAAEFVFRSGRGVG